MKLFAVATILVAVAVAVSAAQAKDVAGRPALVKVVLDYNKPSSRAADAFFKALDAHSGKAISLVLEIVPKQDKNDPGFSLAKDQRGSATSDKILCGQDNYGVVDNYRSAYRLGFQHPENFHAPTEIMIGERTQYPFHAIRCGTENYTTKELTHLHVSGHFVVMTAGIPTANTYTLYPYAP